jgi:hypothetical protein
MDNPEKLASLGTQYAEKHNTICAGHHHALSINISIKHLKGLPIYNIHITTILFKNYACRNI